RTGSARREAAAVRIARNPAGIPAADAVLGGRRRAADPASSRVARRPAAGRGHGSVVRFLSERAPAETASARGPAPAAFSRLRGRIDASCRRPSAGADIARVRSATAVRARLRAAADARGRYRTAGRSVGTVLLRLRPGSAQHGVGTRTPLSAGARRDLAGAGAARL